MVLIHLPVVPSEEMEQWFHHQKTDSADGVREGIVRGTRGDTEYSPNIHRNSPTGRVHDIQGIEPLIQDMLPEQPVSSSVIQSRGAVCNKLQPRQSAFHLLYCTLYSHPIPLLSIENTKGTTSTYRDNCVILHLVLRD